MDFNDEGDSVYILPDEEPINEIFSHQLDGEYNSDNESIEVHPTHALVGINDENNTGYDHTILLTPTTDNTIIDAELEFNDEENSQYSDHTHDMLNEQESGNKLNIINFVTSLKNFKNKNDESFINELNSLGINFTQLFNAPIIVIHTGENSNEEIKEKIKKINLEYIFWVKFNNINETSKKSLSIHNLKINNILIGNTQNYIGIIILTKEQHKQLQIEINKNPLTLNRGEIFNYYNELCNKTCL